MAGISISAVYTVPLDDLRGLPVSQKNSRKKKLARMVARDFIGREEIDEMFREYDPPNTLYAAVQQILAGEHLMENRGTLYGYAVEALCWAVGTTFFMPFGFPTVEYMDKFLKKRSSPVTLKELVFSGFPLPIPQPGDFPFAGYWSTEQVIAASEFFSSLRVEKEDQTIQVGVAEIQEWLEEAINHETDAVVGFCY
jgi:hypothetical protein